MKILALVPARGGSKRLPGKNIKLLAGKPLIAWTLEAARASKACVDVLVSTDDEKIASVAREYGALVPWLRPAELATDTSTSVDTALHALSSYEDAHGAVDGLLLLQPTSPLRTEKSIKSAVELFESDGGVRAVVSVSPAPIHPSWCFRTDGEHIFPYLGWDAIALRGQDLPPAYTLNGSIYIISPSELRAKLSFVTQDARPFFTIAEESVDIDTASDWSAAHAAMTSTEQM
jgi:CMP-N-acetylneuraminic acid synthetase